jgi:signal transduction histidine kinase
VIERVVALCGPGFRRRPHLRLGIPLAETLPGLPLHIDSTVLLLYNGVFALLGLGLEEQFESPSWLVRASRLATAQVLADLTLLTYLIYFSGGLENPFVFYYIFHMIPWIPHFAVLTIPPSRAGAGSTAPLLGRYLGLVSCLCIAFYLTTTVVNQLRQREPEESNRVLAEQDRLKSRCVMTVSHDIQASLSAIDACLEVVLNGFTGRIVAKTREMIQRAAGRSPLLLRFGRDLLDLSRMRGEAGGDSEGSRERLALVEIIEREIEMPRPRIEDTRLAVIPSDQAGQPQVFGERTGLGQLFHNLIGNAVRYRPPGGPVTVTLTKGSKDGTAEHGAGLGLAIAKQIVQNHGGGTRVESEVGRGTRFVVTLFVLAEKQPVAHPVASETSK